MTDLPFQPAVALAAAIREKRISSRELLALYLERLERLNPRLNAIIATDLDTAHARAEAADAAQARGELWGPLHGVPMTVKESFDVAGLPTTWGLSELKDNRATQDALAVARYRAAGANVFGKTNVPVLLADWQSYNPVYGTTNNPWDLARAPGGSSGGGAAALAAGLTGLETGSDIGASIRNPAHYCGVYGHKPTWGICPPRGHALPGVVAQSDISVIGPLARSAADLSLALGIIAGPDAIDAAGWRLSLAPPKRERLADFRVAVMRSDAASEVDATVQDRLQALADFLARQGARVSDTARPALDTAEVSRLFVKLLRAATSGRQSDAVFLRNLALARDLAPDDESYYAAMTRANVLPHKEWLAANEQRHRMRLAWATFFEEYDLLLCPAAATAACLHDQVGERHTRTIPVNGRPTPVTDQLFWAGYAGLFYLPATVAPIGCTPDGLPVGVQIVGPQYGDLTCIRFAALLEQSFGGFVAPAGWS